MYSVTSFLLANPSAGLLALLGLAVPVAIHLWNRRPGRTVQVGSIRWLTVTANRRLRNLRLEQFWLLLLRAAVLVLLALAVAGPLWQQVRPAAPARGVVLLAPETLQPEVLPALRPAIDSLRKQGAVLRLFAPGFRGISARAWANLDSLARLVASPASPTQPVTLKSAAFRPTTAPDDYWARARQAVDSFPDQSVYLVTGTAQRHFTGPRPALPARLTWQPVPLPDSVVWVAGATLAAPDTLQLLLGTSHDAATTFRVVKQKAPRTAGPLLVAGLPELRYQPAQRSQPAIIQQPSHPPVAVSTQPLRILLYTDAAHAESGRYVQAALQAAALGLAQQLDIRRVSPDIVFSDATPPNWLFWLSEQPVPARWQAQVKRGTQLWQEARGQGALLETELDLTGFATAPPIRISHLDTTQVKNATVVWQDGTGRPVLTHQVSGSGGLYQLRTRLQPTWSGLPDSPALPELFLQLLRPVPPTAYAFQDFRQLDARQLKGGGSVKTTGTSSSVAARRVALNTVTTDLRSWVVLAAVALFGLERWLASRRAVISSSSPTL